MNTILVDHGKKSDEETRAKLGSAAFVGLCFLLSSVFWYLIATKSKGHGRAIFLMWCPAIAAVITRAGFQRNLRGFGYNRARARWLIGMMSLPIWVGLLMFSSAWVSGVAPLNRVTV